MGKSGNILPTPTELMNNHGCVVSDVSVLGKKQSKKIGKIPKILKKNKTSK